MTWLAIAIQVAYFAVLSLLALYGLHRLSLVWIYLRARPAQEPPPTIQSSRPAVTVQLPIYDEFYVVERLVAAACALRYPQGLLEIQLLDDSTDGTSEVAARLVASYRAQGHDIHHLRRPHREGYKAGALAAGLGTARGELIAVFDADFIPPPDFLERVVPRFSDPRLGMVQTRWGHTNRDHSLLTRAQALLLDGHFIVEHGARQASGRFLNFNGTAGVFRRRCIDEAGGWQADTLTEDLDLSYRAQLAGWRFAYAADVVVPAELPVEINALKSQQRRWAKGSIQTAVKLLAAVLRSRLPLPVKLEAVFHLTNNAAYLLLAILSILIVPALASRGDWGAWFLPFDLALFLAGTGSFALFCGVAQRQVRDDWWRTLAQLPAMMSIGVGLCLNNGFAVLSALSTSPSEFQRTPKHGTGADGVMTPHAAGGPVYRGQRSLLVILEALFAIYFTGAVIVALRSEWFDAVPFLLLFASGFLYVATHSILQEIKGLRAPSAHPKEAPAA